MLDFLNKVRDRFAPVRPLPAGTYHYQAPQDSPNPYRLHLRLGENGEGILIVNASTVLHLNQTAAEYAYHLIKNSPETLVAQNISSRYRVGKDQAFQDFQDLKERIQILASTQDLDPVSYMDFERRDPYATTLTAPYRLDCALTYRVSGNSGKKVAPEENVKRELTTEEWYTVLDKAWDAGIPHVIFTGGEPTLRPDLLDMISHCEQIGQVTGLLTDGLRLAETDYLHALLQSGLDHVLIVLQPDKEQSWEAIRDTIAEDISVTVHLTVTSKNKTKVDDYLKKLAKMDVKNISLSAEDASLGVALQVARQTAADLQLSLIWDIPVPYSTINPVSLETSEESLPTGAGQAWLYVEPDGDILPAQGGKRVLGNLLNDDWKTIWNNR